ncbi:5841_t:CDS:2, partial [Gigaspora margarita]
ATLNRVAKFLKPFKELTTKMLSSANIIAFWIIPLFNIIFDHVEDTALAEEIETAIAAQEKLVQYYSKTNTTIMLCTALDPRRKFHYFIKKEFSEDKINKTKILMRNIFETKYLLSTTNHNSNISNKIKSTTQSILDLAFDDDDKNFDELECYISEKPTNKDLMYLFGGR